MKAAIIFLALCTPAMAVPTYVQTVDPSAFDPAGAAAALPSKQSSAPSSGPGVGLCRDTIIPANTLTIGGIVGTTGACARIMQCGTSATYVVEQFNVGSGC